MKVRELRCDGCSGPGAVWEHPCADFEWDAAQSPDKRRASWGSWIFCEACHRRVEAGRVFGLADRSARALARKHGLGRGYVHGLREQVLAAQAPFWQHQRGMPRRLTDDRRRRLEMLPEEFTDTTELG